MRGKGGRAGWKGERGGEGRFRARWKLAARYNRREINALFHASRE